MRRRRARTIAGGLAALGVMACGGILGLNEDDPPTNDPNPDAGTTTGVVDGGDGGAQLDGRPDRSSSTSYCTSKTSAALCVDFDGDDGGSKLPQIASVGAKLNIIDGDASLPHALLIEVPPSPTDPAWASMQADIQLGTQKTITIEADLRIDAVNLSSVSYTHVLVVSFGNGLEPRYEVTLDPSGVSLFKYGPDGAMNVVSSGNVQLPIGSWLRLNLLLRVGVGAAVLQLGSTIVQFTPGDGITTDLPYFRTGPNVWVGSGMIQTGIAYDNFVVTLSP